MRVFACAALVCAALSQSVSGTPAHGQEGKIFPFEYRRVDLENGMRAYLIRAGAPDQIAYVTMVRTGSRDEVEEGKTGFAHFFEHMMFRGTPKYPNYDGVTEAMGAARNAFTSNDRTVYYLVIGSEYLEKVMDLESDRFRNLDYAEAAFRTEAGAVLGEYQNSASSPFLVLDRATRETAFEKHTYRHTTIGFEADVRAMPEGFEYSRSFYDRFYRPENVVVVIAGDFDFDEAEQLLSDYYGDWAPGYEAPAIPTEPRQTAPRERQVDYPGRTLPILSINYKAPAWSATDRIAVATEVLGSLAFGENSDIYRKLVIEEQRLQFLNAGFGLARDPGLVSVSAMVAAPDDVAAIREELLSTAAAFKDELVDPERFDATKSHMKYSFLMGLETAQSVAFSLMAVVINTGGIEGIEDYYRTLDSITAEDVREAARQVVRDEGRTIVLLSQKGGAS